MPYADMDRQREYQNDWLTARRRKVEALLGGLCAMCGATEDLEIDHVYPRDKDPAIKGGGFPFSWSWSRIEVELTKCWLLCKECHRIKTRDDRPELLHGTAGMWHAMKCRCDECRAWMAAAQRDYRARKKSIGV